MNKSLSNIADSYKIMFSSQQSYLLDISTALFQAIEEKDAREVIENLFEQLLTQLKTYFDLSDVLLSLSLRKRSKKLLHTNKELLLIFTKFKDHVHTEQLDILLNQIELILKELDLHMNEMNNVVNLFTDKENRKYKALSHENTFGIDIIDFQHEQILELNNETIELAKKEENLDTIVDMYGELINEFKLHFAFEEFYLLQFNYPDYPKHKEEHNSLSSKMILDLNKIKNRCLNIPLSEYFITILELIENHIKTYDADYVTYIKASGLLK